MTSMQHDMGRLFDRFFGQDWFLEPFQRVGAWTPAIDVVETDDAITVKAELPGLSGHDLKVSLTGDLLTIKGEKKEEKEEKTMNFHRVERSYGSFERSIKLPVAVKNDEIHATFKDGVLSIELPKSRHSKTIPVKIDIK